jgi:hypothetical protein
MTVKLVTTTGLSWPDAVAAAKRQTAQWTKIARR